MHDLCEDSDDFEKLSVRFIEWLKQNGAEISSKIELADLRGQSAGRGVVARDDIDDDEELFSIPRSSILTCNTSELSSNIDDIPEDPWLSLILTMVYEYQRGSESKWEPYFDVLPDYFDTLMYWSHEELGLLQGSAVVNKIGKAGADKTFKEQLDPIIRAHPTLFNVESLNDDDLLDLCHLMGSVIMAYAFDVEKTSVEEHGAEDGWEEDSEDGEILPKGMVPLADMLNADADRNNSKLYYEDDKVVMRTIKPVKKGEELFNDYGPLPRADLLRRYGYITDNYAQYDVVEVSLELIKQTARAELPLKRNEIDQRTQYLDDQGALDDGYDVARASNEDGQFSGELKILLNALTIPGDEFDKLQRKDKVPKPNLSEDAAKLLYQILIRRRSEYPQDTHILPEFEVAQAAVQTLGAPSERLRRKMALEVISGELQVLQEAAESLREQLGDGNKRKADVFDQEILEHEQTSKRKKGDEVE